jgi:hypothetical protein
VLTRAGVPLERLAPQAWLHRLDARLAQQPTRSLAQLRALLPVAGSNDAELRLAFAGLLTDNPRLFDHGGGSSLLIDTDAAGASIGPAIAAYARTLIAAAPPASAEPDTTWR